MKSLKILENKDGKIVVEVRVRKRKLSSDPYIQVGYSEVVEFLKSEGIKQGLHLVEGNLIGNHAENVPRVGKFVFIDPKLQKQTSNFNGLLQYDLSVW